MAVERRSRLQAQSLRGTSKGAGWSLAPEYRIRTYSPHVLAWALAGLLWALTRPIECSIHPPHWARFRDRWAQLSDKDSKCLNSSGKQLVGT